MNSDAAPYLHAVLRLVPNIERAEALNVGLVMFSRPHRFLELRWELNDARLACLAPQAPLILLRAHLATLEQIARGDPSGGPISGLDMGERFHWLTNISNTMIQPGPVHPGVTTSAERTFNDLFTRLVATDSVSP